MHRALVIVAFSVAAGTLAIVSCSGGASCGNGTVDPGEQCDVGAQNGQPGIACSADCKSISVPHVQIQVVWQLLEQTGVAGFGGAHCGDVNAAVAQVSVTGATTFDETIDCLKYGKVFAANCPEADGGMTSCGVPLPEGDYTATITLLDGNGAAITHAVSSKKTLVKAGSLTNLLVDFEMPDFQKSYTGALQLRTSWGADGSNCAAAVPPVTGESLWLVATGPNATGQPVAGMTVDGTLLDGTAGACFTPTNNKPTERAMGIPWGPYSLTIEGFAAGSMAPAYCATLPVFIGPGPSGTIWSPLVPSAATAPDGGCM